MGNVDQLHSRGIKGKGIKIALIDTGVDYTHPSLGGGFGPGYKIAFGTDLVGDAYTGSNTPVPDDDPLVTCTSGFHGTHVSGIIGAVDAPGTGFGLVGVAPEATLGMYRVFGCEGNAGIDVLIDAIQQASEEGVDIISMSIGSQVYFEVNSPYTTAVKNAIANGTIFIASAGNDGQLGPFAVSAPAVDPGVVSIGSIENDIYPAVYHALDSNGHNINYLSTISFTASKAFTVYPLGFGLTLPPYTTLDGCFFDGWAAAAAPGAIQDPEHTTILVPANEFCTLDDFITEIPQTNVTRIIISTSDPDQPVIYNPPGLANNITIILLDFASSQLVNKGVYDAQAVGKNYTLLFKDKDIHDASSPAGGTVDFFSTIGRSIEGTLQPSLSAPGGSILSTYPVSGGGYGVFSGTSQAAPFAAGCFALLKYARPDLSSTDMVSIMQSTSRPLVGQNDGKVLSSTGQQGGGLIDCLSAVQAESVVIPSQLSLRDTATPKPQNLTVKNLSKDSKKSFTVSHDPAAYIRLVTNLTGGDFYYYEQFELVNEKQYAKASFSRSQFDLAPGQSIEFEVTLSPPKESTDLEITQPTYSGFVQIDESSTQHTIPYIGIPYSRYDAKDILPTNLTAAFGEDLPGIFDRDLQEVDVDFRVFQLEDPSGIAPIGDIGYPYISFFISQPSIYTRADLVPINNTFVPTRYGFNTSKVFDPSANPPKLSLAKGLFGVPSYINLGEWLGTNAVPEGPDGGEDVTFVLGPYLFASYEVITGQNYAGPGGTLGLNITGGDYRVLLRSLRYSGDINNPKDYISWLGPVMRILPFDPSD
jgi:subtilisin family serine protease